MRVRNLIRTAVIGAIMAVAIGSNVFALGVPIDTTLSDEIGYCDVGLYSDPDSGDARVYLERSDDFPTPEGSEYSNGVSLQRSDSCSRISLPLKC